MAIYVKTLLKERSDSFFLSDNYDSYFVGYLNIVMKILVYS